MFDRIKALTHRWQDLKEIAQLSQRDLDDLGMTRDQVEASRGCRRTCPTALWRWRRFLV